MRDDDEGYYSIPLGCICVGDGLYGMKCEAKEHARWVCRHRRLNEDGICRACSADKRGIGEPVSAAGSTEGDENG